MSEHPLLRKLEEHIEAQSILGFDVGNGEEVIDFLARLEMEVVEQLLADNFTDPERELLLNWVEERKGQLVDHELPPSEARRRADHRKVIKRRRR
jgi:hypothetical protein